MVKVGTRNVVKGYFPNNEVEYESANNLFLFAYPDGDITFKLIFESNEDFFNLQVVKKLYDTVRFKTQRAILEIPFFPYSQMDRNVSGHLFSLYVAQIINDMNFDEVHICDPHSDVLPAVINHCVVEYPVKSFLIDDAHFNDVPTYDLLFFPDSGAAKKYSEVLNTANYRFGNKKHSLKTGEIIQYEVIASKEDIEGKSILIVDDICMSGQTFINAAKALRNMGAKHVELYVTHLMPQARDFYNSKGDGLLDEIHSADTLNLIKSF